MCLGNESLPYLFIYLFIYLFSFTAWILDVTSYIRTVIEFIFSNSVSLDPSMQIEKGCDLILLRRSLISMGASASLSIQVAFVEAEWYFKAIFESVRDSIKTRVLQQNPGIYFNGCPCHNAAQKAGESFTEISGFDIEEFVTDLFYWFDKSTKQKNGLQSYCMFCDQEYCKVMKHVSTRWLSLEIAVEHSLKQFHSLAS